MPGGKRRLKQLFTGGMKIGATGINSKKILSGSVSFATTGCADTTVTNACSVAEATITNLGPCDIMLGTVWGMSACFMFNGEVLAGDGQASIVYRYAGCGGSADSSTATLRYIAFQI